MPTNALASARWYTLLEAARLLSFSPAALRRRLERRARRTPDGGTEAEVDGVKARKFGNRWRVSFNTAWAVPIQASRRPSP
jgi:hypothetical protein